MLHDGPDSWEFSGLAVYSLCQPTAMVGTGTCIISDLGCVFLHCKAEEGNVPFGSPIPGNSPIPFDTRSWPNKWRRDGNLATLWSHHSHSLPASLCKVTLVSKIAPLYLLSFANQKAAKTMAKSLLRYTGQCWAWWQTSVIPGLWEAGQDHKLKPSLGSLVI